MDVYTTVADIPAHFGPSAVAIGKFDGVHAGHRTLIGQLTAAASARGLKTVTVTFDKNPLSILRPEAYPRPLVSNQQKIELLSSIGVDSTLILTFDRQLSDMQPEDFVRTVLVEKLGAQVVIVGYDFKFGKQGRGTIDTLRTLGSKYGFQVVVVGDVVVNAGEFGEHRASSTWIRQLLTDGRVREAATLLEYLPRVRGVVVEGEKRGRELGYPTANLSPDMEGFIPADGVYAAWLTVDRTRYGAAVSVGNNPTFAGVPDKQVEAHVLDADLDLYGRVVEVAFVDYIRPMLKFDAIEPLVEQMIDDERRIRDVLGYPPRSTPFYTTPVAS